ncbi:DUF4974 domain-containing protein [Chitinophaga silvatica]|uniref:DUF4974 domain-containing protein n=1 Tax=Chitinophaga silvatica TaxID=2282649 RepID=A0A3E1YEY9_9BACT|nr:FecR domain-containing protein [Chitinophaga silvatica]RFS25049.1 DUF4974 domain-containing protein [Chitinophaga silvatica]
MKNELHDMIIEHLLHPENEALTQSINQWMAEDAKNKQTYQDIKFLWESSADLPSSLHDQNNGWQQLATQLQLPATEKTKIFRLGSYWKQIAAAAILLVVIGSYLWFSHQPTEHWTTFAVNNPVIDSVALPDGSSVIARPGTIIAYTTNKGIRKVKLEKGEAFFNVTKDAAHTFTIELPQGMITVLGTSFNVKINSNYTDVAVWDGSVKISDNNTLQSKILLPGNLGILHNDGSLSQPAGNYAYRCAWSNHDLVFKDQEISQVVDAMATYYGAKLKVEDQTVLKKKITVRFNNIPLQDALLVLSEMMDLKMKKTADSTYLFTNQ